MTVLLTSTIKNLMRIAKENPEAAQLTVTQDELAQHGYKNTLAFVRALFDELDEKVVITEYILVSENKETGDLTVTFDPFGHITKAYSESKGETIQ